MAVRHVLLSHNDDINQLFVDGQDCDSAEQVVDLILSAYRGHAAKVIRLHDCQGPDCKFETNHYKILSFLNELEEQNKKPKNEN